MFYLQPLETFTNSKARVPLPWVLVVSIAHNSWLSENQIRAAATELRLPRLDGATLRERRKQITVHLGAQF